LKKLKNLIIFIILILTFPINIEAIGTKVTIKEAKGVRIYDDPLGTTVIYKDKYVVRIQNDEHGSRIIDDKGVDEIIYIEDIGKTIINNNFVKIVVK